MILLRKIMCLNSLDIVSIFFLCVFCVKVPRGKNNFCANIWNIFSSSLWNLFIKIMQLARTSKDRVDAGIGQGYIIFSTDEENAIQYCICYLCDGDERMDHDRFHEHVKSNRHCTEYLVSLE